jgi:hypothetical protein
MNNEKRKSQKKNRIQNTPERHERNVARIPLATRTATHQLHRKLSTQLSLTLTHVVTVTSAYAPSPLVRPPFPQLGAQLSVSLFFL